MLQIKNTLGGSKPEGLYAWKKSVGTGVVKETPSTERYYFTTSQSESVTIYYSSSYTYDNGDFVLTNPSEINIALGAYNAIEANLYFMVNTSRGNVMLKSSSGSNNQRTVIYNWESGLFAHCPDATFPFYICNDTYEFLDYIVSNKENAYPDGGEKGGYWYEKVVEFDVSALGITNFEIGSFILTREAPYNTVNHSLGIMPKAAILFSDDLPKKMAEIFNDYGSGGVILLDSDNNVQTHTYDAKATATTVKFNAITNTYGFNAGVEYRYAIFA